MVRKRLLCRAMFVAGVSLALLPANVLAVVQFQKQFALTYVKKDSDDPAAKEFESKVRKAKCNVCHLGKDKKMLNVYGKALSELLDHKKDKTDEEKIVNALKTVADKPSAPDAPDAPTFGQLIEKGDLPAPAEGDAE